MRQRDHDGDSIRTNGIVNIVVGFAPLKPAEFVIIQIQTDRRTARGVRRCIHGAIHASSRSATIPTRISSFA